MVYKVKRKRPKENHNIFESACQRFGFSVILIHMNLEAFVLGCGGMMPLPYRHLTSVLLRREGQLFLFDGGEGTQVSLRQLNLK